MSLSKRQIQTVEEGEENFDLSSIIFPDLPGIEATLSVMDFTNIEQVLDNFSGIQLIENESVACE